MADANVQVKDATGATLELKAKGAGSVGDPHRLMHHTADGDNVSLGTTTDVAATAGAAGTVAAKLRRLTSQVDGIGTALSNLLAQDLGRTSLLTAVVPVVEGNTAIATPTSGRKVAVVMVKVLLAADGTVTFGNGNGLSVGPLPLKAGLPLEFPYTRGVTWIACPNLDDVLSIDVTGSGNTGTVCLVYWLDD